MTTFAPDLVERIRHILLVIIIKTVIYIYIYDVFDDQLPERNLPALSYFAQQREIAEHIFANQFFYVVNVVNLVRAIIDDDFQIPAAES